MCQHALGGPDLWFRRFEIIRLFALGDMGLGQGESLLQVVGLVQRLGEQGVTEIGEIRLLGATEGDPVFAGRGHDQGSFILERRDETAGVTGGNHDDLVAVLQRCQRRGQFVGRQVGQFQARLIEDQLMFMGAMAGQVDEDQVFRPAALGQGLGGAAQVLAGGHRAIAKVVAMVHQADLAIGAEAGGEHLVDVIGLAHEDALLAVAGQHQAVEFDGRSRGRHGGQGFFQQRALGQQAELQQIGQQLAVGIADPLAVGPGAALHAAVGQGQAATTVVGVAGEFADIDAAVAQGQMALAVEAPLAELTAIVAAVDADQLALAVEHAFLEFTDPDIAIGVFVAALAIQLVALETAGILVAVGAVEGTDPFQLTVDEVAGEQVAVGVATLALAVGLAVGEFGLVLAAVFQFQMAEARVLVVLAFAAVGHAGFFERAFAIAPALLEAAGVVAVVHGQGALAVEQALLELALVDLAIAAMPLAVALPLAMVELAGVPAAAGVVDTALALQQPIDHFAAIATAVRQTSVRR